MIGHIMRDHASKNIPLRYDEGYWLGELAIKGCRGDKMAQIQSVAALSALHNKATYGWQKNLRLEQAHGHPLPINASTQIAGICAAVFREDIGKSEAKFLDPNVSYVMDSSGMGGSLIVTPNVSTLAALIAAGAGIPICKHGSPANADPGKCGSSDFISSICGIDNFAPKRVVEECIERFGFGYVEACDTKYKLIHTQTHKFAKLPHMNDIIGPITNPVNPQKLTRRILGINHLISPRVVAEAYLVLNQMGVTNLKHGFFMRGFADESRRIGIPEASIFPGGTLVAEIKEGKIFEYELFAEDFGIESVSADSVYPIGKKGEFSFRILRGEVSGAARDLVLANAAVMLLLGEKASDLKNAFLLAGEILASKKPYEIMELVRGATQKKG